ncbi:hypothetical protein ES319_D13G101100v1, partial [Gossypium barbadense]
FSGLFWVFILRKYYFGSSFQIYGCRCGCSCWMLWERKKLWFCKILPAMASLLQSTTLLFIFSITLILIPNRHAIPFIVLRELHVFGGLLEDHISMPMFEHVLEMNSDTVV